MRNLLLRPIQAKVCLLALLCSLHQLPEVEGFAAGVVSKSTLTTALTPCRNLPSFDHHHRHRLHPNAFVRITQQRHHVSGHHMPTPPHGFSTFASITTRRLSSTFDELAAAIPIDEDENSMIPNTNQDSKRPELWLDLRGTALSPSEALDHLQELLLMNHEKFGNNLRDDEDDDDDSNSNNKVDAQPLILSWIDRVLVSPEQLFQQKHSSTNNNNDVYYVTNDRPEHNDYQLLVQSRNEQSFRIGKVISITDDDLQQQQQQQSGKRNNDDSSFYWKLNPLLAMETVGMGEWYWVDCHSAAWTTASCTPALTSLLDMVSLAATADATSLPKSTTSPLLGLFESYDETPNDGDQQGKRQSDNNEATATAPDATLASSPSLFGVTGSKNAGGGLALTCPTAEALWQAASLFVQQDQQGRSQMTKSGILIPTATTPLSSPQFSSLPPQTELSATEISTITTRTTGNKAISLALVLPFDAGLWKTAETLLITNSNVAV